MRKTLLARLIGFLLPPIGPGQTPVVPDNGALPDQVGLVNAILGINPLQEVVYNADATAASKTLSGQEMAGAAQVYLGFTGAPGAGVAATLPTVANLIAALPPVLQANPIGVTWQLRVLNGTGQTITMTTNTGWTLNGTMTVATLTFVDFVVTIAGTIAAPVATLQRVGSGVAP